MIRSHKCALCGQVVEANGIYQFQDKMRAHWQTVHPKEYADLRSHNRELDEQIKALKDKMKCLFV